MKFCKKQSFMRLVGNPFSWRARMSLSPKGLAKPRPFFYKSQLPFLALVTFHSFVENPLSWQADSSFSPKTLTKPRPSFNKSQLSFFPLEIFHSPHKLFSVKPDSIRRKYQNRINYEIFLCLCHNRMMHPWWDEFLNFMVLPPNQIDTGITKYAIGVVLVSLLLTFNIFHTLF